LRSGSSKADPVLRQSGSSRSHPSPLGSPEISDITVLHEVGARLPVSDRTRARFLPHGASYTSSAVTWCAAWNSGSHSPERAVRVAKERAWVVLSGGRLTSWATSTAHRSPSVRGPLPHLGALQGPLPHFRSATPPPRRSVGAGGRASAGRAPQVPRALALGQHPPTGGRPRRPSLPYHPSRRRADDQDVRTTAGP
jgi:hypothetical protein